jgi:3-hydroxyisobutyrate dehydrogenase
MTAAPARTVALLGGGIMAAAVAPRLRAAGNTLRLYNRTKERLNEFQVPTDVVCDSPEAAASGAQAVLSFVFDDQASRAVWFGPKGAFHSASNALVVECSTLSVEYVEKWAGAADSWRARPVYAPVTGSKPGAEAGDLVVFAGGSEAHIAEAAGLLKAVAQEIIPFSSHAKAAQFKLLNNLLAATILCGLAETLVAAEFMGFDLSCVVDIFSRHGWGAAVTRSKGGLMATGRHDRPDCALSTIAKDLDYALDEIAANRTDLAIAQRIRAVFAHAAREGYGALDMSAIHPSLLLRSAINGEGTK